MQPAEIARIEAAIGRTVVDTRILAGGFSHETCLLTLASGRVVARLGGSDPAIEAAVMEAASRYVPVPRVELVIPAVGGGRPAMVLDFVEGTPLSHVLAYGQHGDTALGELGAVVGEAIAAVAAVTLDRPGFFTDASLAVGNEPAWSEQLPGFAATCMAKVPDGRLDQAARQAWASLCAACAPALTTVDHHARLSHADANPKNVLVAGDGEGWRVTALLDWEFSFSGCPYGDAANMARFAADYPPDFIDGFLSAFAEHQPVDLPLAGDWLYLGRVLDMFALSDLVTRAAGHQVADRAAEVIKLWVTDGVPL